MARFCTKRELLSLYICAIFEGVADKRRRTHNAISVGG